MKEGSIFTYGRGREQKFGISLLLLAVASVILIINTQIEELNQVGHGILIGASILVLVMGIFMMLFATLYISVHPTDIALKMRFKRFTGKTLKGGWCFYFPFLEEFIVFDSRTCTIFLALLGARGHQKTQVREFEHFKEKFLTVDEKRYYSPSELQFDLSDFYMFGPLITTSREEINMMCAVNYRILEPLKLAKSLNIIENLNEEKTKFKPMLVAKITSALKETVARMSLDEIFEERQKLMELLVRSLADLKDDWGIDVLSVSIEEQWLEDEKLQEMLDEKKKAEIIADAKQIVERHDAEIKNILAKAEQDKETMLAKAREECNYIQEQARREGAKLRQDLMELRAEGEKIMIETQSKARKIIADVEAQRLRMINKVIDEKIIQHELINTIPMIMDQISLSNEKFVLVPSSKHPLFPFPFMGGNNGGENGSN